MQSKKGAIELSMTTIIVIVMGVTLLILGLVFIRGIFTKISGLTEGAFSEAEEEIQQRMGATQKIYTSGGLKWDVEPGVSLPRVVGIQNFDENLDSSAKFTVEILPNDDKSKKYWKEDWFVISQPGNIKAGEKATVPVEVKLPKGLPPGSSYSFLIKVLKNTKEYETQAIIVSIKESK